MNLALRDPQAAQRLTVVDCDIHPTWRTPAELHPFMAQRWREHMTAYGTFFRHGLTGQLPFPRMMAGGMRADSFPADGSPPGADLDLMRRQHLDANGVEVGMLIASAAAASRSATSTSPPPSPAPPTTGSSNAG
jgi:hypothetical protein